VEALDYDFNLSKLERVMSGAGKVAALGHELERRGLKRRIVVTGKTLGGSALLEKVTGAAGARCVAAFKGARQHVPGSSVHELQVLIERENADSLIGFGGGSPIDLGLSPRDLAFRSIGRTQRRARSRARIAPHSSLRASTCRIV
jgi:alcohol dehydrogenase class IV